MNNGFIRVTAASNTISVADVCFNLDNIKIEFDKADKIKSNIIVFPELSLTGASCGDLFLSETLQKSAINGLADFCKYTSGKYPIAIVGLPVMFKGKLYNCSAVVYNGEILAIVPKFNLKVNELRVFSKADTKFDYIVIAEKEIPFGTNIIFENKYIFEYSFALDTGNYFINSNEFLECVPMIIKPIAEFSSSEEYSLINTISISETKKYNCSLVVSGANYSESTQDGVYNGKKLIAECGEILASVDGFDPHKSITSEIDVYKCANRFNDITNFDGLYTVVFEQKKVKHELMRCYTKNPFLSNDKNRQLENILDIQAYGLKKRLEHTHASKIVIGISGGLDSTLALISAVRTLKLMNRSTEDILAITMPCFGTTSRTRSNAEKLCECFGIKVKEINISKAVRQHFIDIGQDEQNHDVTYENSQARERTQILMDVANMSNGLVLGTGDLSELALGWATYNGDHMSMYAINADITKTMIREIVSYVAEKTDIRQLSDVLNDILDTPVSPELLPTDNKDEINQMTEDLVGPYELHDFFIYYTLKYGYSPEKIFRITKKAFTGVYEDTVILKWLEIFFRRFFIQQFKRSCMPDGPKVFSISLSPRGDWCMPTDASYNLWKNEIEQIKKDV